MGDWTTGWHMGWMGFGWVLLLLLIAAVVWVASRAGARPDQRPPRDSPEDLLKRRYAAGEIDRNEYERKLTDLRK